MNGLMFDPVWADTDKYLAALDDFEARVDAAAESVSEIAEDIDVQSIIDDYATHTCDPDGFKQFCTEADIRHQLNSADPYQFVDSGEVDESAIESFFESEVEDRWNEFCERA